MDNNSYYRLFLLFFIGLLLYAEATFEFTSKVNDVKVKCIEGERKALLKFKQGVEDDYALLSSWVSGEGNKECCKWWGVKCNNRTGHVISLDLHRDLWSWFDGRNLRGEIGHSLTELPHLSFLDISYNDFTGVIPHQLGNLTNLRTLVLGRNLGLTINNLEWLSQLRSLRQLDLAGIYLNGTNWLQVIFNLPQLEELHLTACRLGHTITSSHVLLNSSSESLSILDLSYNSLTSSSTYYWLFNVSKNLVSLSLKANLLEGPIPNAFKDMISLENVDLSENQMSRLLPNLTVFSSLRTLDLRSNKLRGRVPESIGQLSKLEILDLSSNFLEGEVSPVHFSRLSKLKRLHLSFNSLSLNMSFDWVPTFRLNIIRLANCSMGPYFPQWLKTQNNFSELDLSSASISDTIPNWFWDLSSKLVYLNLSHNLINGKLPELTHIFHGYPRIDLSSNNFSGQILSVPHNLTLLHLYQNRFKGSISFLCATNGDFFKSIDLSDNQFSGYLPNCWTNMTSLSILNLGNNYFSGPIPKSFGFLRVLQTLHLRNNSFVGEFPSSLKDCRELKVIDFGGNKLTSKIPTWIGTHLTSLVILSLRSNKFHGNIPQDICHLSSIQILDLSGNNITGKIPPCLYNFTTLVQSNSSSGTIKFDLPAFDGYFFLTTDGDGDMDNVMVQWKRQESEYKKILGYLKVIDLSSNRLVGTIPREIANLQGLMSLNLSSNLLVGNIIEHIGKMEMLESLDLSRNQLSGEIPTDLAHLHYLSVLDLSYNNLSGKIPSGTQLQSFDASTFIGNNELCGLPLEACPWDASESQPRDHEKNNNVQNEDEFITREFYLCLGSGFIFGLLGVFAIMLRASWRNAYFRFLENTNDWIYVTSRVSVARLTRMLHG